VATFVLVHGAWSGAHGFRHVRRLLQHRGHEVFTPSLTGIGERRHLTSPLVDLTTHVHDVVNLALYEDVRDVVLLGFSYGGCVVTGAVDHLSTRIRHLVYLDAFVPEDGDSVFSMTGQSDVHHIALEEQWLLPPAPRAFDDPAEAEFMSARRTPQPRACFAEAVSLGRPLEEHPFTRTYIRATADSPTAPFTAVFDAAAEHARRSSAWHSREIHTNHMVSSNRPEELAAMLLELV
jgi:pimeloyl-ACP methyl ester carboxylesterase